MQQIASTIKTKEAVTDVEDDIASVNEVLDFKVQTNCRCRETLL